MSTAMSKSMLNEVAPVAHGAIDQARNHNIGQLLRRSAVRHPDKLAIICGSVRYSYQDLDRLCSAVASGFSRLGIRPGDRVAVLARNSHAYAIIRFALARMGAVLVPINFMLNPTEIAYILKHSGARLLCIDADCEKNGREALTHGTEVEQIVGLPGERSPSPEAETSFEDLTAAEDHPEDVIVDARAVAQIIYTSGTESAPKGAMLTHEAVMWEYVTCLIDGEMSGSDIMLHAMPLYHCAQLDVFLGPAVYAGITSIITSDPTPENLLLLMEQHGITSFFAPPTVWIGLLNSPRFSSAALASLRKGYYGASIMPVGILKKMQEVLPNVRFFNLYGQTEIAPVATVLKPEDQLSRAGSAGQAALNVETRVVDDLGNDVPPGKIGEVVHRSPQLMIGYFKDEERTAEAFRGGWFHSGDLATRDSDGYITIVDRKKDMIKTGGENVASREVEEALYQLRGIKEVAVIGLPHPTWVEAVAAVVVPDAAGVLSAEDVIAHCRNRLAHFKCPKHVIFVDQLPKNPSGKIMKRKLRIDYANIFEGGTA